MTTTITVETSGSPAAVLIRENHISTDGRFHANARYETFVPQNSKMQFFVTQGSQTLQVAELCPDAHMLPVAAASSDEPPTANAAA